MEKVSHPFWGRVNWSFGFRRIRITGVKLLCTMKRVFVFVGREIIFFVFSGGDDPGKKDCGFSSK